MGVVYLAHDDLLDRHVAIKLIPTVDDEVLARFLVEARAAARLQHPNVATLYRVGQLEDRPYLIYEFVRGTSLDQVAKPMDPAEVLRIAIDLARGLAAAHRRGVLHRDIKPGNAMLADTGEAKILDFGIAKLMGDAVPEPVPDTGRLSTEDEQQLRDLTHGQLLGTPYFMSPEAWRGRADERSDLFSLGLVMYELLAGKGPFRDVPLGELPRAVVDRDARALGSVAPGVPEAFAAVVDRCIVRKPDGRWQSADELVARLEALRPARASARVPEGNPYRGLRPFEPEHRGLFFGRQRAIAQALDRLRVERFVLVTGDSGVGKSSICAAGLLPLVGEGALEDGRTWTIARMVPGRAPVLALAAALAPMLKDEAGIEKVVRDDPGGLGRHARRSLRDGDGVLLYVDQLEELATIATPAEAALVSEAIGSMGAGLPGVRVLATARSDFLSRLEALSGFAGRVSRALLLLAPLGRDEVREAIVGPAAVKHTRFESEAMVDRLVDTGQGAMPLLQFALAELWEKREGEVIPEKALEALGGVNGALSKHADSLLAALLPAERAAARTLLLRLVTADRTRARRLDEELVGGSPHARPALDALVRGRLVVAGDSPDGTTYEIAHEALVDGWSTLSHWLSEESETRALLLRIEAASTEWRKHGRRRDLLFGARQLAETTSLPADQLTPRDREFLEASGRASQRLRWLIRAGAVAVVLLAIGVYAGARYKASLDRDREIDDKLHAGDTVHADAHRAYDQYVADRDAAFALFDAHDPGAEAAWAKVIAERADVVTKYRAAEPPLDSALLLDASRSDTRRSLGDLLFDRARVADEDHLADERDEFLARMKTFDADGHLMQRWNAPAHLAITSDPPGATVTVRRYSDQQGRFVLDDGTPLGATPIETDLPPGSIVVELATPGRPTVIDPVLLARGESLHVDVPVPAAVPDGFVYVPPGRTLYGTNGDEAARTFFDTVPQHAITTGPYLIARDEVTFADWLAFLDTLPDAERAARTPHTSITGAQGGALALHRDATGWSIDLQPGDQPLHAGPGESIHYPRTRNADQDWSKLPVGGVSLADAEAYAAWLSAKVPGARLCTEAEWERAARGADDRLFPSGRVLGPDDANIDATYGKDAKTMGPDDVGLHPGGRSPFGVDDLTGNVWEWVTTDPTGAHGAARGGSFYYGDLTSQIANRQEPTPDYRDLSLGVRLCATVSFPSR